MEIDYEQIYKEAFVEVFNELKAHKQIQHLVFESFIFTVKAVYKGPHINDKDLVWFFIKYIGSGWRIYAYENSVAVSNFEEAVENFKILVKEKFLEFNDLIKHEKELN